MNVHPLGPRDHEDAARVASSWLTERHRKSWRNAFVALPDLWRPEGPRDSWQLDEDGMTMVSINAGEWLIARGEIHARGGLRDINAYLLGREGLFLTPGQRDWIAQLRARPLRLYRVADVQPGAGMTLIDEFDPQAQPQPVLEISGSRSAEPGMLMGARIMEVAAGARRSLSIINPGRSTDRVELFHRTQRLADDGRAWFEGVAGAAVQHLRREITDPAGHLARAGGGQDGNNTGRTPRSLQLTGRSAQEQIRRLASK